MGTRAFSGLLNNFGSESAMVAAGALVGLYLENRELKRSDAIDLLHATYLPHTTCGAAIARLATCF